VLAAEGDRVAQGQLLAVIDPTTVELELRQAERRVDVVQSQLELLLAGAREEDLTLAETGLDQARQALDLTEKSFARTKSLYEGGSATTSDFDKARTELDQARSRVRAAQAQLEKLQGLVRPEELGSARSQVAEARAAADRVRARLADTRILAPRSGTVTTRVREAGEYVTPGMPLLTLAEMARVRLTIYVPGPALSKIALGQDAEVTVDGRPGESFPGRVTRVAEEAEFTPKNVQTSEARAKLVYAVQISLDNPDGVFKIGMPADARILRQEP
jgi:HlyD family secretion protein